MARIMVKDIWIESEIRFSMINSLRVEERINEHATAYMSGILNDQMTEEMVYGLSIRSNVRIIVTEDSEGKVIFAGVPIDLEMRHMSGVRHLSITLRSHSFKLDIQKQSRSYQDVNSPYRAIFTQIVQSEHSGIVFDFASQGMGQGRFILQYKETDWQFLKRVASQLGAIIYPHMEANIPQIGIGTPNSQIHMENPPQFEMKNEVSDFWENASNFQGWGRFDFVSSALESDRVYKLCDIVICNDVRYLVAERVSELYQGVLVNSYRLQQLNSFRQNILFNENLVGTSIQGTVLAIQEDKVKLRLSIDQNQSAGGAYWFDCNTPYVAEGHSGMYIMPEIGAQVQLYCPDRDEQRAYIRPVLRHGGAPKAGDPNTKIFETVDGMELKLSPTGISLSAKGQSTLQMSEDGGISYSSNGDICIQGSEIDMGGRRVNIKAGDLLSMCTGSASVEIDDEIDVKGVGVVNFFN